MIGISYCVLAALAVLLFRPERVIEPRQRPARNRVHVHELGSTIANSITYEPFLSTAAWVYVICTVDTSGARNVQLCEVKLRQLRTFCLVDWLSSQYRQNTL
jgi:hypothetical protein